MPRHRDLNPGDIHSLHNYTYADASARTGATGFVGADIGKLAKQSDNNSYWILIDTTPTWTEITSTGGGGLSETTFQENKNFWNEAIRHITTAADGYGAGSISAAEGSDGYLAFFTSATSIAGDNDLFWDRANSYLGIGTTPTAPLTVRARENAPWLTIQRSDSNTDQLRWFFTQGTAYTASTGNSSGVWTQTVDAGNSNIMISTNENGGTGGELWLDASTGVGIGVAEYDTAIAAPLHVIVHNAEKVAEFRRLQSGANRPYFEFNISDNSGNWQAAFDASLTGLDISTGASSRHIRFLPNSAEAMRIDAGNGNVAIGTTDPSAGRLTILDSNVLNVIATNSMSSGTNKQGTFNTLHLYNATEEPFVALQALSFTGGNFVDIGGGTGAGNAATVIRFITAKDAATLGGTEKARFTSDGNLGLGTAFPQEKLTINGAIAFETQASITAANDYDGYGRLYVNNDEKIYFRDKDGTEFDLTSGGGGGVTSAQGADGYLAFFTGSGAIAGDNDLFFDRVNNRLGVGTSSPDDKLHVVGSQIRIDNTGVDNGVANFITESSAWGQILFEDTADGVQAGQIAYNHSGDYMAFYTGTPSEKMRITSAGNVGIGIASPAQALSVVGEAEILADAGELVEGLGFHTHYSSGNTSSRVFFAENDAKDFGFSLLYKGGSSPTLGGVVISAPSSNAFSILHHESSTTGAVALGIARATGYVGIGTSSPSTTLDVEATTASVHINSTGATADATLQFQNAGTAVWTLGFDDSDSDKFKIGTTALETGTALEITSAGIVDVVSGTFHVGNAGDASIHIESDIGNSGENDNGWLKITQDGGAVGMILGTTGATAVDPEGNAYTGAITNSTLLGTFGDAQRLQFGTDEVVRMTIEYSAGNVGIGTTNPDDILHVQGAVALAPVRIAVDNTDASGKSTFIFRESGTAKGWLEYDNQLDEVLLNSEAGELKLQTYRKTAISISDIQNVGINTLDPHERLTLNGAMAFQTLSGLNANHDIDGYGRLYVNNDEKIYFRDKDGTEFDLTSGGGGGVTSAQGADGYLAFFTGSDAIAGDNDLFFDRVNNRLGIGETSPDAQLHVRSLGGNAIIKIENSGDLNGSILLFSRERSSGTDVGSAYIRSRSFASNFDARLEFGVNTAVGETSTTNVAMTMYGHGGTDQRVGIRTDPTGTLNTVFEVTDNATSQAIIQKITQDDANTTGLIIGNDTWSTTDTNGLTFSVTDAGVGTIHTVGGSDNLALGTEGTTVLTIDEEQNVAIGNTTNPDSLLHVQGASGDSSAIELHVRNQSSAGYTRVNVHGSSKRFHIDVYGHNYEAATMAGKPLFNAAVLAGNVASSEPSMVLFGTREPNPVYLMTDETIALTISDLQHVGIGTELPIERLTVDGVIALSEQGATPANQDGYGKLWVDSAGELNYVDDDSNSVRITLAGAVDAAGGGSGNVSAPTSGDGIPHDGYVAFFTDTDTIGGDNDFFWDRTNNRLGVGTIPSYKLHVRAGLDDAQFRISTTEGGAEMFMQPYAGTEARFGSTNNVPLIFFVNSVEAGRFDTSKNFTGEADITATDDLFVESGTGSNIFALTGSTSESIITASGNNDLKFRVDSTSEQIEFAIPVGGDGLAAVLHGASDIPTFTIGHSSTGAARVGIGTRTPGDDLTVIKNASGANVAVQIWNFAAAASSNAVLHLHTEDDGGDPYIWFDIEGTSHWSAGIDNDGGDKFKIIASSNLNSGTDFVFDKFARMGIGTELPHESLTINGVISLQEQDDYTRTHDGYGSVWAKSDGTLQFTNDAGTDFDLTAAGGGSGDVTQTTDFTGSDGYIAFFTGDKEIAGDNDLSYNRETNTLNVPNIDLGTWATPFVAVLTSGTSFQFDSAGKVEIWVIGAGGGGAGAATDGSAGGGAGAGGVSYKTFDASGTQTVTYTIGASGTAGSGANDGNDGGDSTATFQAVLLTGGGGIGGTYNDNTNAAGGTFSGGDSGSVGGTGGGAGGDNGGGGGGGIGDADKTAHTNNDGQDGAQSNDVDGLQAVITAAVGFSFTTFGAGDTSDGAETSHGGDATGVGCGGGGGGWFGGNGGDGLYGGGGGGAAGLATTWPGGLGGQGIIVIKTSFS